MTESKRASHHTSKIGSDLAKVDAHVATAQEFDEIPELTEGWIATADMHQGGKLVRRGRPMAEKTKVPVKLRLDVEVVQAFKADGPGWQTRMNDFLKKFKAKSRAVEEPVRRLPAPKVQMEGLDKLVVYREGVAVGRASLNREDKLWHVYSKVTGGKVVATASSKKEATVLLLKTSRGLRSGKSTTKVAGSASRRQRVRIAKTASH
jgi:uncharacterized protein (DUF4415 family)